MVSMLTLPLVGFFATRQLDDQNRSHVPGVFEVFEKTDDLLFVFEDPFVSPPATDVLNEERIARIVGQGMRLHGYISDGHVANPSSAAITSKSSQFSSRRIGNELFAFARPTDELVDIGDAFVLQ